MSKSNMQTYWLIELRPAPGSDQTKISYYTNTKGPDGRPNHTVNRTDAHRWSNETAANQVAKFLNTSSRVNGTWKVAKHMSDDRSGFHASTERVNSAAGMKAVLDDFFSPRPGSKILASGFGGPMFAGMGGNDDSVVGELEGDSLVYDDFDMWLAALKRVKQANLAGFFAQADLDPETIVRPNHPDLPGYDIGYSTPSGSFPQSIRAALAVATNVDPRVMLHKPDSNELNLERAEAMKAAGVPIWEPGEDDDYFGAMLIDMGDYYL